MFRKNKDKVKGTDIWSEVCTYYGCQSRGSHQVLDRSGLVRVVATNDIRPAPRSEVIADNLYYGGTRTRYGRAVREQEKCIHHGTSPTSLEPTREEQNDEVDDALRAGKPERNMGESAERNMGVSPIKNKRKSEETAKAQPAQASASSASQTQPLPIQDGALTAADEKAKKRRIGRQNIRRGRIRTSLETRTSRRQTSRRTTWRTRTRSPSSTRRISRYCLRWIVHITKYH